MGDRLAGKVAIVTGGAGAIGSAAVELFAREGARVVIADLQETEGRKLADRIGNAASFCRTDVGRKEDIQAVVDHAIETFGRLDVMFNNAAISGAFHNRFLDDDLADFDKVMQVDLASVMFGSQFAARHMAAQGGGSIINTTSIAALDPSFAVFSYRAAKAGVVNFTRSLAMDLGEYGIRVNAIAPGHIPTTMNEFGADGLTAEESAGLRAAMHAAWTFNQPLKRPSSGRDVAHAALFFASDESAFVTGQVLAVDGGVTGGSAYNQNAMLTQARAAFLASIGK